MRSAEGCQLQGEPGLSSGADVSTPTAAARHEGIVFSLCGWVGGRGWGQSFVPTAEVYSS